MSGITERSVVREESSAYEALAGASVGLATLLFVVGIASTFDVLSVTDPVVGVPLLAAIGALLLALGLAVIGFGAASYTGAVSTDPDVSAGLIAAVLFGGIWSVIGGLVAAQTLGLSGLGWVLAAVAVGGGAFAVTAFLREDLGSTLPAGAFGAFAGLVLVTGIIGPGWAWSPSSFPDGQAVTFFGETVGPLFAALAALVVGWAAAKAYGGFGARGRHLGAYSLIYLNAGSIIAVLFILVAFVFVNGLGPVMEGFAVGLGVGPTHTISLLGWRFAGELFGLSFAFGLPELSFAVTLPVDWPFVMNGVGILNDVNGVLPAIVGTIWLVVGAVLFAVPLGVGAAVFLTEYAERGRFTQVVEIATNGLWSTPSIVFGLFGYAFLLPRFTPAPRKTLLAGQLTLGFMLLPLVVITSREAMLSVPDEYRDASAALGVSRWETIRSVVLPAAMPGVITGVILGVGRIAGETAPILLTMAGGTFTSGSATVDVINGFELSTSPPFVTNPELLQATAALPYQLYALIQAGVGQSSGIENMSAFQWGTALVLLAVVLAFYAIGIATRQYFRRKLQYE